MFSLGAPELIIILVILVMLFGVGKLPEVGSSIGKTIREFRTSMSGEADDMKDEGKKSDEAPKDAAA